MGFKLNPFTGALDEIANISEIINLLTAENYSTYKVERIIKQESDLPALNAQGEHTLEAGVKYVFEDISVDGAVVLQNPLRLPPASEGFGVQFTSSSDNQTIVIYEGTGALIRGTGVDLLFIRTLDFVGDGTNKLFDVCGTWDGATGFFTSVFATSFYSANEFDEVGIISNFGISLEATPLYTENNKGVTYENIGFLSNNNTQVINESDLGNETAFIFKNSIKNLTLNIVSAQPFTGASVLDIQPSVDADITAGNINATFNDGNGGLFYPSRATAAITVFADNSDTDSITAFAETTKDFVTVTSASHDLTEGAIITISGTTNYDGTYKASSVDTNTFQIRSVFVADDATGTWTNNATTVTSATHGLSLHDAVLIEGTTNYDGGYEIYNVTTNTFDIPKSFVADDATGTWDTNSLKQDDPRINILGQGVSKSIILGGMYFTGNSGATDIENLNAWVKIAGTTIESSENERFEMTGNNELTSRNIGPASVSAFISVSVSKSGNEQNFEFGLFKNAALINPVKGIAVAGTEKSVTFFVSTTIAEDDVFEVKVRNTSGTDDITASNLNIIIK